MKYTAENNKKYTTAKDNKIKDIIKQLQYKPQHLKPKQKRTLKNKVKDLVSQLRYEQQHSISKRSAKKYEKRKLRNNPKKTETKTFVAKGKMKHKFKTLLLVAAMGLTAFIPALAENPDLEKDTDSNNSIEHIESIEGVEESQDNIKVTTPEGEVIFFESVTENEDNIEVEENVQEDTVETINEVEENESEDEIKTIYGGEISASENGMRTADEILYAVTQMGWGEAEIENIIEMMDGLLRIQEDFDIDPLCALAVFHHESTCGVAYEQYGQHRLANIQKWSGQKGVIGYSNTGSYGLYEDYNTAVYDFANYVRNSSALKGAKTMADLESFNGYGCIFNGAATADANTYNRLKQCLEKDYLDEFNGINENLQSQEEWTEEGVQQLLDSVAITDDSLTMTGNSEIKSKPKINYNEKISEVKGQSETITNIEVSELEAKGKTVNYNEENNKVEDNNKLQNEIKTIYSGEISASKNGMRTEDEILYAVTEMGWSEAEIENVIEMLDGLMKIQEDFDIDPLCALAVFHHESTCGVAYEQYGQHRLANIQKWSGQKGVIGYSNTGSYGLYEDYNSAVYDFANYVRNSSALKGAKTMADLESFNGYGCIFKGAATADANTYNRLKQCLERNYSASEVSVDDIFQLIEGCTVEEIQEMTGSIKSNLQNENSRNQVDKGEKGER